jgi:hypothetical protein
MSIIKSGAMWAILAAFLVLGCGCSSDEGGPNRLQAIPLGGSNGYVLIQHPNGKLYTIQLENGQAEAVWSMPDLNKR